MQINIVFRNSNFIVIDKPAGALSTPSRMGRSDPRPVVGIILQEQLATKIFPVHRLDEEVSGLLLFALNASAHREANRWFETHEVRKTYEAASVALPADQNPNAQTVLIWKSKLLRGKKRAYEADFGKESLTKAKLLISEPDRTIWHLQPLTGRSHQLRYEMAKHGFPIDGDILYGSDRTNKSGEGIALRAIHLDFRSASKAGELGLPTNLQLTSLATFTDF